MILHYDAGDGVGSATIRACPGGALILHYVARSVAHSEKSSLHRDELGGGQFDCERAT
jgi:hypothetical protein